MQATDSSRETADAPPLTAIIIGAGFGGIGMAVALKQARAGSFVILEKRHDVGGVWRDNTYPGAACDVPSHLYSFSFEPNPEWSRAFAAQSEIHAYLRNCADKYGLLPHIRFGAEVECAVFDEQNSLWRVTLKDGSVLSATMLVSATGQLSRPVYPRIEGIGDFKGRAFHSATWDHSYPLAGKRVAVIGTGASAIQFVPAIADTVDRLTVFQRSAAYVLPRPDRVYQKWERSLFRALPATIKLNRAFIYLRYEARALGFTRFKGLMKLAVGIPFRMLLKRQVPDAQRRAKLIPDYPIGCKRILLSSDYLAAMSKPNVDLVTQPIRRITADGVETADGVHHKVDAIVYGTGFAATEFLSPMRIIGRNGTSLNDVWRGGAQAYLGLSVPGFPNFFMLYGPNTNLGHNSIVYMLESQIAHVVRCYRAMKEVQASTIEVDGSTHQRFNMAIQRRLANTVWQGCRSWYVDEKGHNSVNWPGFTVTYRWLTKYAPLASYKLARALTGQADGVCIAAPNGLAERATAGFLRIFLRTSFRPFIGPPFGPRFQRGLVAALSPLMPGVVGVTVSRSTANGVPTELVSPKTPHGQGAILYLHGGAFCLGGPRTHRSISTRLAREAGMPLWFPDYRLAPEHPYPAALDDALACYQSMLDRGHAPGDIVVAGDSAGAALALALALRLRDLGKPVPAGLLLISPVADFSLGGSTMSANRRIDPMVREGWVKQSLEWYACPQSVSLHRPLEADLGGLPPMLVQVGEQEVLFSDSTRLADHATRCGVPCRLEVYEGRWHVFHLQSFYLPSARAALRGMADFARSRIASKPPVSNTSCERKEAIC